MADGTIDGTNYVLDGYSPYKTNGSTKGSAMAQTIQNVGNFTILYTSKTLGGLAGKTIGGVEYKGITSTKIGGDMAGAVYLTGFKLDSMIVSADQQIDNAKLVPLVNGDSITLTNLCKAGVISFTAARTAAGINGGDCVAIFDFVRSQGDDGGILEISWRMNGKERKMIFSGVCVQRCPPLAMAGNDVADYGITLTYSSYTDSDSPAFNNALGSMMSS